MVIVMMKKVCLVVVARASGSSTAWGRRKYTHTHTHIIFLVSIFFCSKGSI
jgi:hypothetical protein